MSAVETASPHLRVSATKGSSTVEAPSARIPPPETSSVEDKFFWTYTEEPHRSRRQAIIKAHPEVCHISEYCPAVSGFVIVSLTLFGGRDNLFLNSRASLNLVY